MEALLAASDESPSCRSVDELQQQFRQILESKVSPARAEHISVSYEFRPDVIFDLTSSDTDVNDALDGLGALINEGRPTQRIKAGDTILSQPHDDPVQQRAVAKHIIGALSQLDGSVWNVRSVSRAAQGWTFRYNCKDSMQSWLHPNAKNAPKHVIAESSGKDGQDPAVLARPAFDCRGSLVIAFSRSRRAITVKYEHTPFHRTVSQLAEYFAPPPPPAPSKRQAESGPAGESSRKKRKKNSEAHAADAAGGAPGEGANDISIVDGTPTTTPNGKPRRKRVYKPKKKSDAQNGIDAGVASLSNGATQPQAGAALDPLLNLPPGEAERRREVANQLLRGGGVDPATLSPEQFNIFANQSPELQRESLAMLIKYGAERLRIVHPSRDSNTTPGSSEPSTPVKATQTNGSGSTGAATPATSSAKKRSRKKKSDAAAAPPPPPPPEEEDNSVAMDATAVDAETPASAAKRSRKSRPPRPSRGKCQGCKARKLPCSKGRPSCTECLEAGNECYYAPPRRRTKSKGAEEAEAADEDDQDEEVEAPAEAEAEAEEEEEEEPDDLPSPGFSQPIVPPQAIPSPQQEFRHTASDWDHTDSGHTYTQPISHDTSTQAIEPSSEMDFSLVSPRNLHQLPSPAAVTFSEPTPAAAIQQSPSRSTKSGTRRSLPNAQRSNANASTATAVPQTTTTSTAVDSTSPTMSYRSQTARQSRSRNAAASEAASAAASAVNPVTSTSQPSTYDGVRQAAALSEAAIQRPAQPSPAAQRSPFQTPAQTTRAKSKQSQRAQSRVPVPEQPAAHLQQQTQTPVTSVSSYTTTTTADTTTVPSYDPYSRYANNSTSKNQSSSSRTAYDAYSNQASTNAPSSYTSYDTYSTHTSTAAASYTTTTAPSNDGWSMTTRSRSNNASYSANSSTAGTGTSSYSSVPSSSSTQHSASLQAFNVRPRATDHQTRSSTGSSYGQSSQQQQQQQQQPSYSSYASQPSASSAASHHQQPQQQPQQQQQQQADWYGLTAANSTSSGYNMRSHGSGASSYGNSHSESTGSYNQHHRSMNVTGHTYNMDSGGNALYDMLRNNHGS